MFAREIHHFSHFCFGNFICEHTANANAALMDVQHNPRRFFNRHLEMTLEDKDDKLHRRVIIIEHQHPVRGRLFRFCPRFGGNANSGAAVFIVILLGHTDYHLVALRHEWGEGQDGFFRI